MRTGRETLGGQGFATPREMKGMQDSCVAPRWGAQPAEYPPGRGEQNLSTQLLPFIWVATKTVPLRLQGPCPAGTHRKGEQWNQGGSLSPAWPPCMEEKRLALFIRFPLLPTQALGHIYHQPSLAMGAQQHRGGEDRPVPVPLAAQGQRQLPNPSTFPPFHPILMSSQLT